MRAVLANQYHKCGKHAYHANTFYLIIHSLPCHSKRFQVMVIFHNYGLELTSVQDAYERYKNFPPAARNMPPVAGNILWSRHLLRRIEGPMERFHSYPGVLQSKDSRKLIKTYNKVRAKCYDYVVRRSQTLTS